MIINATISNVDIAKRIAALTNKLVKIIVSNPE